MYLCSMLWPKFIFINDFGGLETFLCSIHKYLFIRYYKKKCNQSFDQKSTNQNSQMEIFLVFFLTSLDFQDNIINEKIRSICGFLIYYKLMFLISSYARRGLEAGVAGIRRWFCSLKESSGTFCCAKTRTKISSGIKNKYWSCCATTVSSFLF